jgi:hypothetical protein
MASKSATEARTLSLPTQDPTVEQPAPTYARSHNVAKRILLKLGPRLPAAVVRPLKQAMAVVEISHWLATSCSRVATTDLGKVERVYDCIAEDVDSKQTLYLEFGVWKGYSIGYWSKLLKHPRAMLHGFDSFEGLPENWTPFYRGGSFSEEGRVPAIVDNRIKFFKGWFADTLPTYVLPEHEAAVVNIDCNIYLSARCVLDFLRQRDAIRLGDWIYFDEFGSLDHEFRAFKEFVEATGMRFEMAAQSNYLWNAAFRRVG